MDYIKKILDIAKSLLNIKKEYDNHIEYLSEDITAIDYGFNVDEVNRQIRELKEEMNNG